MSKKTGSRESQGLPKTITDTPGQVLRQHFLLRSKRAQTKAVMTSPEKGTITKKSRPEKGVGECLIPIGLHGDGAPIGDAVAEKPEAPSLVEHIGSCRGMGRTSNYHGFYYNSTGKLFKPTCPCCSEPLECPTCIALKKELR